MQKINNPFDRIKHGELLDKVALVTGASSGIGRATAIRLAEEGALISALARTEIKLDETLRMIEKEVGSNRAMHIVCDVTKEQSVVDAFQKTIQTFSGLDIVVSNAGSMQNAPIEDTSLKLWLDMYNVLATGYFLVSREAFRYWKKTRNGGSIVFVSSKNAVAPTVGASAYASAKAASQHLARCLAEEGGPSGIRINCVMPDGVIHGTNILPAGQREKSAARHGIHPDQLEEYYRQRNALKVMITPEDVAEAILFLAGPRSAKITGACITVDGGMAVAYMR